MTGVCIPGYRVLTMQLIRQDMWLGLYLIVVQGNNSFILACVLTMLYEGMVG